MYAAEPLDKSAPILETETQRVIEIISSTLRTPFHKERENKTRIIGRFKYLREFSRPKEMCASPANVLNSKSDLIDCSAVTSIGGSDGNCQRTFQKTP